MNKGQHKPFMSRGRFIFLICLLIIFAFLASCVRNESSGEERVERENLTQQYQDLLQMNQASELAYQHVRDHLPKQAYQEVQSLSRMLTQFQFSGFTGVEGMAAITSAVTELSGRLHAVQYDEEQTLQSAIKVRLAIDALGEREQPMWRQYGNTMRTDLGGLKQAADENNLAAMQVHLASLQKHYQIVRPSLLIRHSSSEIQRTDSLLNYMNRVFIHGETTSHGKSIPAQQLVSELQKAFASIFEWNSSATYIAIDEARQQLLISLVLASIIITVLAYVGWRKYHYDYRKIQPVHGNNEAREKKRMY